MSTGSTASIGIDALRPGTTYHWQARGVDPQGAASGWVEFLGVPPPAPPPSSGGGGGSVTTGGGCGGTIAARREGSLLWILGPLLAALALRRVRRAC
jgi:hypothetical protein